MANNPVPLLIPCHRVIKNDGTTSSYAFGAEEKVGLLEGEGVPVGELAGSPYLATPTTGIFCHATCANARRIKSENRRHFRSAKAAVNAGFRPCECAVRWWPCERSKRCDGRRRSREVE